MSYVQAYVDKLWEILYDLQKIYSVCKMNLQVSAMIIFESPWSWDDGDGVKEQKLRSIIQSVNFSLITIRKSVKTVTLSCKC